jgi:hypothetical protein
MAADDGGRSERTMGATRSTHAGVDGNRREQGCEQLGAVGSSDGLPCTTLQRNKDRAKLDTVANRRSIEAEPIAKQELRRSMMRGPIWQARRRGGHRCCCSDMKYLLPKQTSTMEAGELPTVDPAVTGEHQVCAPWEMSREELSIREQLRPAQNESPTRRLGAGAELGKVAAKESTMARTAPRPGRPPRRARCCPATSSSRVGAPGARRLRRPATRRERAGAPRWGLRPARWRAGRAPESRAGRGPVEVTSSAMGRAHGREGLDRRLWMGLSREGAATARWRTSWRPSATGKERAAGGEDEGERARLGAMGEDRSRDDAGLCERMQASKSLHA